MKEDAEAVKKVALKAFHNIEQTLGKALGYPWYKDDLKNFPGATEADGVCVGDHVAETIALEAADSIVALKEEKAEYRTVIQAWNVKGKQLEEENKRLRSGLKKLEWCVEGYNEYANPEISHNCPVCGSSPEYGDGQHAPDCWLSALLKGDSND